MTFQARLYAIVAGVLLAAIGTGVALTAVAASGTVPQASNYDDQIAAAEKKQKSVEQKLNDLESSLENTNAALVKANRQLLELQAKVPVVKAELATAKERLNAALVQQKIVADKLDAAQKQDEAITQQISDDAARIEDLKVTIGVLARDEYMGAGSSNSLSVIFGASTSRDFVDAFAAQHSASRVQTNALDEIEQIAATNRNRGARQEAVRDYIEELKMQADALVVEADKARKIAQAKQDELDKNLAAQARLKAELEAKKAQAIADQKEAEKQQKALENEIVALVKKKLAAENAGQKTPIGKGYLSFPTANPYITSNYGMRYHPILHYYTMHNGTDFRAYCGTPIYSTGSGKVLWAKYRSGYGSQVMLDHGIVNGNSLMTSYNHLSKFAVKTGQHISRGTIVGYSGTEGLSTGCHLHFEVYVNGKTVDPISILGPVP